MEVEAFGVGGRGGEAYSRMELVAARKRTEVVRVGRANDRGKRSGRESREEKPKQADWLLVIIY